MASNRFTIPIPNDPPLTETHGTAIVKGRLLIVDDHDLLRDGVAAFLSQQWEIVAQASNGAEAIRCAELHAPDVIVMDLAMPDMSGIQAATLILAKQPKSCIILYTQQMSREQLGAAFRAGVRAYVAKQSVAQELKVALDVVLAGGYYVTPNAVVPELEGKAGRPMVDNPAGLIISPLTPRQLEVLKLIAAGKSTKEIAAALQISTKTVEFHRNCIVDELGIRTSAELTHYALANGIVQL